MTPLFCASKEQSDRVPLLFAASARKDADHLQDAVEKVSRFGKAETELIKPERKQEEPVNAAVLRPVSTGSGTGKSDEEIEGQ
jgi:hypothetical protein